MEERGLDGRVAELSGSADRGRRGLLPHEPVVRRACAGELGIGEGSQARRTRTGSEVDHPLTLDDAGVVLGPIHQSQRAADPASARLGVVERSASMAESVEMCRCSAGSPAMETIDSRVRTSRQRMA